MMIWSTGSKVLEKTIFFNLHQLSIQSVSIVSQWVQALISLFSIGSHQNGLFHKHDNGCGHDEYII